MKRTLYILLLLGFTVLSAFTSRARNQEPDTLFQKYDIAQEMQPGLFRVIEDGQTGVVSRDGRVIVPCRYDQVWTPDKDQFIRVLKDMKTGLYHMEQGLILPAEYDQIWSFQNGLAKVMQNGKFGFINSEGAMLVPAEYQHVKKPENGRIRVIQNGRTGYLSAKGEVIIPPVYQHIGPFHNGRARVIRDGKSGIIDEKGNEIIPAVYDRIGSFSNGEAILLKNGKFFRADTAGQVIAQTEQPVTPRDSASGININREGKRPSRIRINDNGIEITYNEKKEQSSSGRYEHRRHFDGHLAGFGLALNGYLDQDGQEELPAGYGFMELNNGKSVEVSIYPFEESLRLIGGWVGLTTGFGIQYNNYRFNLKSYADIGENGKAWFPEISPEASITKSKLMVLHGKVPLMLEIQIPDHTGGHDFFMAGGVTGDVRLQSHTKLVYHENNNREKKKKRDDMGLPTFRYGYMAKAGYGSFSLYGTYYPEPMFKNDEGPEIHPYSVGVMLNF